MIIQKDKALLHNSRYQAEIFTLYDIMRLLWFKNSSNLNIIELYWPWLKKKTCKTGA